MTEQWSDTADAGDPTDVWDVIIIGAGPAGAFTAYLAAKRSLRTLLVEKQEFPRDKVCGGCLNPRAVDVLSMAGLANELDRAGAPHLSRLQIHAGGRTLSLNSVHGRAISRRTLDAALVDAAVAAGAEFQAGVQARVRSVHSTGDFREVLLERPASRTRAFARVVVAADGLGHPCLRETPGFEMRTAANSHVGIGTILSPHQLALQVPVDTISMAVGRHGYLGAVRVEGGKINVAAAMNPVQLRQQGLEAAVQQLLRDAGFPPDMLRGAPWIGTRSLTCQSADVAAPRLFLVGDAIGYVEPFTGEGMAWALRSAWDVIPLVERSCHCWQDAEASEWHAHVQMRRKRDQRACRAVARSLRMTRVTHAAMAILARYPMLATPLVHHLNRKLVKNEVLS
jgi:flavin-dependent dehydrogenase